MEPSYGKVFVLQRDIAADGEQIVTSKLLESIFFSNIDYKWYDSEGNLSPLYEKYKGRSFAVQFNYNQKDKNGQEVELRGKINIPYKLGEIGHQDFESVAEVTEEMTNIWRNCGVLSHDGLKDDGYNILQKAQTASCIAALCPGWKIADIRTLHMWYDPTFILDDYVDKSASQKGVTFETSNLFWSTLTSVVEGTPFEFEESKDVQTLSKFPDQYLKMIKATQEVRNVIVEKKGDPTYVIQALKNWNDAVSIENCLEWKQKQEDPSSKMYAEVQKPIRVITIGTIITFEFILFDKGIQISEKVRESLLFKSIMDACAEHSGLINDILSLKKEMDVDETSNMVHVWHHRDGLSLQDACQKAVDRINLLEQVVNETGELLTHFFGEKGAVVHKECKYLINADVQWHGLCTRYHSDFKFDCIVEIE